MGTSYLLCILLARPVENGFILSLLWLGGSWAPRALSLCGLLGVCGETERGRGATWTWQSFQLSVTRKPVTKSKHVRRSEPGSWFSGEKGKNKMKTWASKTGSKGV